MFKVYLSLIVFSLFFCSCSKEKREKLNAPEAIKELILKSTNCTCDPYINKYLWRGKTVYLWSCNGPACDCMTIYYNESGEKFNMDAGYTPDNFRQESRLVKNIWSCKQK